VEKRRSTVLNSDVIEPKLGGKTLIYEQLCPAMKTLLWETRMKAKEAEWKYVWERNDKIWARQTDDSRSIKVTSDEDLENIKAKDKQAVADLSISLIHQILIINIEFLNCDSNGECEEVSDVNKLICDKTITVRHLNIRSFKVNFDSL
jgi:hypothetical protein